MPFYQLELAYVHRGQHHHAQAALQAVNTV